MRQPARVAHGQVDAVPDVRLRVARRSARRTSRSSTPLVGAMNGWTCVVVVEVDLPGERARGSVPSSAIGARARVRDRSARRCRACPAGGWVIVAAGAWFDVTVSVASLLTPCRTRSSRRARNARRCRRLVTVASV